MTRTQRLVIALLALCDIAIIAAMAAAVTGVYGPNGMPTAIAAPRLAASAAAPGADRYREFVAASERACAWQAAELLHYTALQGTTEWRSDGELAYTLLYPLAEGQPAAEAAQAIWTVFDIALALRDQPGCGGMRTVSVAVRAAGDGELTEFLARARVADLVTHAVGALGDQAFIERVDYSVKARKVR